MAYDTLSDPAIDALLLVALRRVNAELRERLNGMPAIVDVFPYPATLDDVNENQRPALMAFRAEEEGVQYGRHYYRLIKAELQYWSHNVAQHKFGTTWPLLHTVATEVFRAVTSSPARVVSDENVERDRQLMLKSGIVEVSDSAFSVKQAHVPGAHQILGWIGTLEVVVDPEVPRRDLGLLRALRVQLDLVREKDDRDPFTGIVTALAKAGSGYSSGFQEGAFG